MQIIASELVPSVLIARLLDIVDCRGYELTDHPLTTTTMLYRMSVNKTKINDDN